MCNPWADVWVLLLLQVLALVHASAVVDVNEVYTVGEELGHGRFSKVHTHLCSPLSRKAT